MATKERGGFGSTAVEAPSIPEKVPPKKSLIKRLANNLALRIVLAGTALAGTGYATYQEVPAVHRAVDNLLGQHGPEIVSDTFDPSAKEGIVQAGINARTVPFEDFQKEIGDTPLPIDDYKLNLRFFPVTSASGAPIKFKIVQEPSGGGRIITNPDGTQKTIPAHNTLLIETAQKDDVQRAPATGKASYYEAIDPNTGNHSLAIKIVNGQGSYWITLVNAKLIAQDIPNEQDYTGQTGTTKLPSGLEVPSYGFIKPIPEVIIKEGEPIAQYINSNKSQFFPGQAEIIYIVRVENTSEGTGIPDLSFSPNPQGKVTVIQ